jgi:hypothetical protein
MNTCVFVLISGINLWTGNYSDIIISNKNSLNNIQNKLQNCERID